MGNILLDMMGLLSRKRVVQNTEDTDYVVLGRTPNPTDGMFTSPKMTNELITIGNLRTMVGDSIWMPVTGGINYPGGNVGIGATTPGAKLDVDGDALINGLTVGKGPGNLSQNVVLGIQALSSNTIGNRNTSIGSQALKDNTTGNYNTAVGKSALFSNETTSRNTAIGDSTLLYTHGEDNTAIGYGAGAQRVGGTNGSSSGCVFIGKLTTSNGIGAVNEIVIGTDAISAGSNTVVLGNDLITSTRLKGNVIVANGNVGIGTTNPSAKLEVYGTTPPQVKIGYDANNYAQINVDSSGNVAVEATGNGFVPPEFKLSTGSGFIKINGLADGNVSIGAGNILFNDYTATATQTGANALDPIQTQQALTADTLAELSVDPTGQVVRGSQEATWSFTLAQLNALTNTKVTLLSAPGSGKAIVVEESNWFMESDPTGSGNFLSDLVCEIDGISTNAVATQLVTARMTEIAASTFNGLGIYSRDVPELNRVYRFNSAMTIKAPAGINSFREV